MKLSRYGLHALHLSIACLLTNSAVLAADRQDIGGRTPKTVDAIDVYAKAFGLSRKEAIRRSVKEREANELNKALLQERDFATLEIASRPDFKILVYAKGDAAGLLRKYTDDPTYEARAVPRSLQELLKAQSEISSLLQRERVMLEIDFELGTVEVFTSEPSVVRRQLSNYRKNFPFINIHHSAGLFEPAATLRAGHRVYSSYSCTSGFVVVNSAAVRGVSTAAHCGDSARINNVTFASFSGRKWGGSYDEQWFTKVGHTYKNEIYISASELIPITSAADPVVGTPVCKFGRNSFQTCGVVVSTYTIAPNDIPDDPSDGITKGVFHRVENVDPDEYMAVGGDSGGPVWSGSGIARGIVFARGEDGSPYEHQMLMQPVSRYSAMGVSVLTVP